MRDNGLELGCACIELAMSDHQIDYLVNQSTNYNLIMLHLYTDAIPAPFNDTMMIFS